MSKAIIVPDLAYTSPKGRRGEGSNGYKEMLAKLKYLQYRNDANGHIPQQQGLERWHDHGLGGNYRDIMNNCATLSSSKVLAWTWVISPSPDLMGLIPAAEREPLLVALTEEIVEAYYEARGAEQPEFAFVMHDRLTNPTDAGTPPEHQLHTHVVLPGTVAAIDGQREPFYNRANKGHIDLLRALATERFAEELDRRVGPEWHALRPEIVPQPLIEPELTTLPPIEYGDGLSELDRWFGRPRDREIS